MKNAILIMITVLLTGCFASKKVETTAVEEKETSTHENNSLAELEKGKNSYAQHCAHCHVLQSPDSQTEENWRVIVPKMVSYVNGDDKNILDEKTEASILNYLITMSNDKTK